MIKDILNSNESMKPNTREIEVLREHFPACFKSDGSFDLARFKEYLNDKVTVKNEGYELKFLGKNYARLLASVDSTTVIVPDEEHNNKPENKNSENIYISGDNLDGLKHLLKSYAGQVKCIYIDPPYNTGSDGFVYNDNFHFTTEELAEKLSIDDEQAQRILDLTKRGSASHSAWLMFMYPRLLLARDLLTDDGVIFISIDDNEQANCKLICDDVFGEENLVTNITWQSRTSIQNDTDISINHEYVLAYAKKRRQNDRRLKEKNYKKWFKTDSFVCQPLPLDKSKFSNPDDDPRGLWKTTPFDAPEERENLSYAIKNPNTNEMFFPSDGRHWSTEESNYFKLLDDKRIVFGQDGTSRPQLKVFYDEKKLYGTIQNTWFTGEDTGTATSATKELQKLFDGKSYFDTPKPTKLIERLLQLAISKEKDGIVLDFFSGSATTAEAIIRKNTIDKRYIKYICVQINSSLEDDLKGMTTDQKKKRTKILQFLKKCHRPCTLDQIGMERIKRAAEKLKAEHPDTTADLGFKHFTLQETQQETLDKLEDFIPEEQGMFIDNDILSDFGVSTVLTTWLVRDGYGFTAPVQKLAFADYHGYYMDKHLYLLDAEISKDAIAAIADKFETDGSFNPENIVIFGYSFTWTALEELKVNLARLKATEKNLHLNFDVRY